MKTLGSICCLLFLFSCGTSIHVEKRKFRPGFYVNLIKPLNKVQPVDNPAENWLQLHKINEVIIPTMANEGEIRTTFSSTRLGAVKTTKQLEKNFRRTKIKTIRHVASSSHLTGTTIHKKQSDNKRRTYNDHWFIFTSLLLFSALAGFLNKTLLKFRSWMNWAKENTGFTRTIIGTSRFALGGIAVYLGHLLHQMHIFTSDVSTYASLAAMGFFALFYPRKKMFRDRPLLALRRQKTIALGISTMAFVFVTGMSNKLPYDEGMSESSKALISMFDLADHSREVTGAIDDDAPYTSGELALNIFLSILLTILALGIILIAAAFSCSLSCQGQEVAAFAVMAVGIVIALALAVGLSLLIWKPRNKDEAATN
jgi:hypothetical protein